MTVDPPGPVLPDETTTVIPAFHARWTAKFNGDRRTSCDEFVPSERFSTRIPYVSLKATTHWMPARMCETSAAPSKPATFTATRFAPGAVPVYFPFEEAPLPAARPAMNVPCP